MKNTILLFFTLLMCIKIYAQDGTLDASFGINGKLSMSMPEMQFVAADIQQDDKVVACFVNGSGNQTSFGVARFLVNGNIDSSFGNNGQVISNISPYADQPTTIKVQPDGKVIVGGWSRIDSTSTITYRCAMVRYDIDGSLDNTFNSTGILFLNIGSSSNIIESLVQPDGKILLGCNSVNSNKLAILRINPNGSLDNTFATNGTYTATSTNVRFRHFDLQPNGKIVVIADSTYAVQIFRLNNNGNIDPSFGTNGSVYMTSMSSNPGISAILIRALTDSNILVSLKTYTLDQSGQENYLFDEDGQETYSQYYVPRPPGSMIYTWGVYNCSALKQPNDGKVILVTYSYIDGAEVSTVLGRFSITNSNTMSVDPSFGTSQGYTYTPSLDQNISSVLLSNNKILTISSLENSNTLNMVRYNNNNEPVPIKSSNLNYKFDGNKTVLLWKTYSEIDNLGFEIEKGYDGKKFAALSFVESKADNGNSNATIDYSFEDNQSITEATYYRFKQIDINGGNYYSNIVKVLPNQNRQFSFSISPNPVIDFLNISIVSEESGNISVYDVTGKLLNKITINKNTSKIDCRNLSSGLYLLKYEDSKNKKDIKFIKQ